MNVKDKFNADIELIEKRAHWEDELTSREIAEEIAQQNGLGYRDMNTIFTYLVGCSLLDYVRERRMMASYQEAISSPRLESEILCALSGYESQSTFINKFKERFDMTPSEAFEKKDETKLTKPKTWEVISKENKKEDNVVEIHPKVETRFGVEIGHYRRMMEAIDLKELYEFNDVQSEIAFELAQKYQNVPMKKIFEYVHDYSVQNCMNEEDEFSKSYKQFRRDLRFCTKEMERALMYDLSISEECDLRYEVERMGYRLEELEPELLDAYVAGQYNLSLPKLVELYENFKNTGDTDFDEFLMETILSFNSEDEEI